MTRKQQAEIIRKTADYVREKFGAEGSGHDWWHMHRVLQLAKTIAANEKDADMFVTELAALLHDVADVKFAGGKDAGLHEIREWLGGLGLDDGVVSQVLTGVQNISFSDSLPGAAIQRVPASIEAKIISDADKLDGIGAIGIARAFAYGGHKGRTLYDPARSPESYEDADTYHNKDTPTINHFYEKLLLLKDRLYTQTARDIAQHRHSVMEQFLAEFYAEWEGKS